MALFILLYIISVSIHLQDDIWDIKCLPSIVFIWLTLLIYPRLKNPYKMKDPYYLHANFPDGLNSLWLQSHIFIHYFLFERKKLRMQRDYEIWPCVAEGKMNRTHQEDISSDFSPSHLTNVYLETVVQALWLPSRPWSTDCHKGRGWWFLPGFQCNSAGQLLLDPGYWCQCFHGQELFSLHSIKV